MSQHSPLRFTSYWLGMVLDEARKRGFRVVDLSGHNANRRALTDTLSSVLQNGPALILGSGHGHPGEFTGQYLEPLLDTNFEMDLRRSPVYLMSCSTGQQLGQHLVSSCNASAFLGYSEDYLLASDECSDVEFDPTIQSFMQLFTIPALTMVYGGSMADGKANARRTYDAWMRYYRTKDSMGAPTALDRVITSRLTHDINALTMHGTDVYVGSEHRKLDIEPILPPLDGVGYLKVGG